jgi:RHS repeat-associated protein
MVRFSNTNIALDYYPFGMLMPGRSYSSTAYKYGFNGKEKDDEVKASGNSLDFGARLYDSRLGRWLSLDPLQAKYPMLTPYSFVANCPLIIIDREGKENVIYLVLADNSVTPKQAQEIAAQATANFRMIGLKTEVVYLDKKMNGETYAQLDKTDGVAVIGQRDNVVNMVHSFKPSFSNELEDQLFGYDNNPEQSENTGNVIAIESTKTVKFAKDAKNTSFIEAAALLINHGRGHNAGLNHQGEQPKINPNPFIKRNDYFFQEQVITPFEPNIMSEGKEMVYLNKGKGLKLFLNIPNNNSNKVGELSNVRAIMERFGNSDPVAKLVNKKNTNPKFGQVMERDK